MKKRMFNAGIIICVCVIAFSGFKIYNNYLKDRQYTDEFESLAEIVEHGRNDSDDSIDENATVNGKDIPSPDYRELSLQNEDMIGWIKIEETSINYPVMYTPDDPDYYLKRNFEKQYSDYGVPYIDSRCNVSLPSDNIIIHGHHIQNGSMFGALGNYKNKSFYEKHKTVLFDTLTERGKYIIFAIFSTEADSDGGFAYHNFIDSAGKDEFNAYVSKCKELSLYETNITAEYGDKLLTLSTCEYFAENGWLVVVAKKIAD